MQSVPALSYRLYRITLNSLGDGVGCTAHAVYYDLEQAKQAVLDKWANDHCKSFVEWKAVNQLNGRTVASKRA